jgi:hypothetical protein
MILYSPINLKIISMLLNPERRSSLLPSVWILFRPLFLLKFLLIQSKELLNSLATKSNSLLQSPAVDTLHSRLNNLMSSLSSGGRKYTDILNKLLTTGRCSVACPRVDTTTIIGGVKKEKVIWTKKKKIPKDKKLKIEVTETGIDFKLILDTSINNL